MCFFTLKCCTGIIQYMLYRYSMYCMVRYSTYLYSPILETGERSESSRYDGSLKAKFCSNNSSKVCHAPVGAMTRPWPILSRYLQALGTSSAHHLAREAIRPKL
jgi:hypothetical protein